METVLEGVVGSTAYGMATETSDIDSLGVFVAPTEQVLGLAWSATEQSKVYHDPDRTLHELGKFCQLALKCNPTVSELLWLDTYTVHSEVGAQLVAIRRSFLSTGLVRDAYGGYARQQVERLRRRGGGSFSADTRKRTAKHARHCYRLLLQGQALLTTGELQVKLSPADATACFEMGDLAAADLDGFLSWWEKADERYARAAGTSVLPEYPHRYVVNDLLVQIRKDFLVDAHPAAT